MTKTGPPTAEPPSSPSGEVLVFVDAIENGFARLLAGDDAFELPERLLPTGTREGAWLRLSLKAAPTPPDQGGELRRKLGRDDDGGDIKL